MALDWWKGEGGDAYTARNRVAWETRIPFWRGVIEQLNPQSVLEVGCNAGWNLRAIREVNRKIKLVGIEPNATACAEANAHRFAVFERRECVKPPFDLVFTAGVLIHVSPTELPETMRWIVEASCRYVIAIEYEAAEETELEYRGQTGLLWKRPFGKLYQDMGLRLIDCAFLPPESGFDRCTYWALAD